MPTITALTEEQTADKPLVRGNPLRSRPRLYSNPILSIRFCPKFFNTLDTMAAKLSALQSEPLQQRIMNNYAGSQALVMFTNTWGLKYTVSDPV